jgi:hypothetical protein
VVVSGGAAVEVLVVEDEVVGEVVDVAAVEEVVSVWLAAPGAKANADTQAASSPASGRRAARAGLPDVVDPPTRQIFAPNGSRIGTSPPEGTPLHAALADRRTALARDRAAGR